jgi:hypothetical protein
VRRLVVCCDGTWDTPAERSNVSLVADALAQGPDQVVRYVSGVGTGTDPITRLLQGGLGLGLDARIREDDLRHVDGTLDEGTLRALGPDCAATLELHRPGDLYAAANDAWVGYGGNRGAATLTVTRA